MNKPFTIIAVVLALATLAAGAALAGSKFNGTGNVVIVQAADGSGNASGYLGHIYNGSNMKQWIGCDHYNDSGLYCHASDINGAVSVGCSSSSAFLAQSVASISSDAKLTFYWGKDGACTRIQVVHSSEYQDKQG